MRELGYRAFSLLQKVPLNSAGLEGVAWATALHAGPELPTPRLPGLPALGTGTSFPM